MTLHLRTLLRLLFAAALIAGFAFALLPVPDVVDLSNHRDKLMHAAAFAGFAVLGCAAWPQRVPQVLVGLVLYGIAKEVAQHFTSWRSGDPLDFIADFTGIMVGLAVWRLFSAPLGR